MDKWSIEGCDIITPGNIIKSGSIAINKGYIEDVKSTSVKSPYVLKIEEGILSPGLINSHDHLLGTYLPKVGDGRPYKNWLPWDNDLKSAPAYMERQQIENRDLYLLGGYKNLISGVTSVHDHIPHFVHKDFLDILPTKVISEFALAHSITSFALNWGEGIDVEYKKAIDQDIPFVTHIAEGFDDETKRDLETLDSKGGLGDHSVLVHSIAFTEKHIDRIKEVGASVVWCADSNYYMYSRTANVKYMLQKKVNVCIGTDSTMSGSLNILDEMRFGRDLYMKMYNEQLPEKQIIKMVTENPAKAFRLYENGSLEKGKLADLAVFRKKKDDSYDSIVSAELRDVMLVVIEGMPVYGDERYSEAFEAAGVKFQKIRIDGSDKIIIGDVAGLMNRIYKAIGYKKKLDFIPVEL